MASISVRLPLTLDDSDGYGMIKKIRNVIKQNLKMLILTEPGERVMEPEFGVGMRRFLFENSSDSVYSQIDKRIREQVRIYIPDISIRKINFYLKEPDSNSVAFKMEYSIPSIAANDLLEFTI